MKMQESKGMKDSLFRGKSIYGRKLVYGYYVYYPQGICNDGKPEHALVDTDKSYIYAIESETLCRCTGISDKNGKMIFEKDIVQCEGQCVGTVRFGRHGSNYGYYIEWCTNKARHCREDLLYWLEEECIEIVGNYFDNPELMANGMKGEIDNE